MSVSICSRCLSRLQISSQRIPSLTPVSSKSSFHSSPVVYNVVKKKNSQSRTPGGYRIGTSAIIKKKRKERPKPPAPGEIRAQKKRIVLSNTNAREIQGLENLSSTNMADADKVGRVLALDGPLLDQLREAKAFKTTQNWGLFRRPATLIRKETIDIGHNMEEVHDSQNTQAPRTFKQIITGDRLSGKSVLLLQAMSKAFLNKWVVISVPEAQDFVNNHSSYTPWRTSEGDKEQLYTQPGLAAALLSRTVSTNAAVLSSLQVTHEHTEAELGITKKMTLQDLARVGANEPSKSWPIWEALWKELNNPKSANSRPPPVLFAVDGINHWMTMTKYRSSDFQILHAHQFVFIRQFLSLLFSSTPLAAGGMILAATTGSNQPSAPSFDVLLQQLKARTGGMDMTDTKFPMPEPYTRVDSRVLDLFKGSEGTIVTRLEGLDMTESRGLLQYYAQSGVFRDPVNDSTVSEKRTLSGGGVIGEMAKLGGRLRTVAPIAGN